jgi:putative holliday junction resolvase
MGRILAIDLGKKRTGMAVTDPLKIIATPLDFIPTADLIPYLKKYVQIEDVESFVVGMPSMLDSSDSEMTKPAVKLVERLKNEFKGITVYTQDERFTSKIALHSMIESGVNKKKRRIKGNVDKISATIILQSFLERKNQ